MALDDNSAATGFMYYDDGDTLEVNEQYYYSEITMEAGELKMEVLHDGYQNMSKRIIEKIHILGVKTDVTTVVVNGVPLPEEDFDFSNGGLFLSNLQLVLNDKFLISIQ